MIFISDRIGPQEMGLVGKGATCNVEGCDNKGNRSINATKVEDAGLRVEPGRKKSILCREHYKEYKKESKDDRDLERSRWS